jgi:hypothetical protein
MAAVALTAQNVALAIASALAALAAVAVLAVRVMIGMVEVAPVVVVVVGEESDEGGYDDNVDGGNEGNGVICSCAYTGGKPRKR